MTDYNLTFSVTHEVLDLGIQVQTLRISDITNSKENTDFEKFKKRELENIKAFWEGKNYKDDPILAGFRELHSKIGRSNRDYVASPEVLTRLFVERGLFPHINIVVDIYNLVSLKTRLALGAHDIVNISGNVALKITNGTESFLPLGKSEKVPVFPGEYGYIDDGNSVICRMEVLQAEPTKVTEATTGIFVIVQGNANTDDNDVRNGAQEVGKLVTQFCGGEVISINM